MVISVLAAVLAFGHDAPHGIEIELIGSRLGGIGGPIQGRGESLIDNTQLAAAAGRLGPGVSVNAEVSLRPGAGSLVHTHSALHVSTYLLRKPLDHRETLVLAFSQLGRPEMSLEMMEAGSKGLLRVSAHPGSPTFVLQGDGNPSMSVKKAGITAHEVFAVIEHGSGEDWKEVDGKLERQVQVLLQMTSNFWLSHRHNDSAFSRDPNVDVAAQAAVVGEQRLAFRQAGDSSTRLRLLSARTDSFAKALSVIVIDPRSRMRTWSIDKIGEDGAFSIPIFDAVPGQYKLIIRSQNSLSKSVMVDLDSEGGAEPVDARLKWGDFDQSGKIEPAELAAIKSRSVRSEWGTQVMELPRVFVFQLDVNGDGLINEQDAAVVRPFVGHLGDD